MGISWRASVPGHAISTEEVQKFNWRENTPLFLISLLITVSPRRLKHAVHSSIWWTNSQTNRNVRGYSRTLNSFILWIIIQSLHVHDTSYTHFISAIFLCRKNCIVVLFTQNIAVLCTKWRQIETRQHFKNCDEIPDDILVISNIKYTQFKWTPSEHENTLRLPACTSWDRQNRILIFFGKC